MIGGGPNLRDPEAIDRSRLLQKEETVNRHVE
jgi:hypothetical protein